MQFEQYCRRNLLLDDKPYVLSQEGFPVIRNLARDFQAPPEMIDYKQALTRLRRDKSGGSLNVGVHFYMNDEELDRFYHNFDLYLEFMKRTSCVLTPDFSLAPAMEKLQKKHAIFRSRQVGQLLQNEGVTVCASLQWEDKDTLSYCYDGLPIGGVYSISTVGVARLAQESPSRAAFRVGFQEALRVLKPRLILLYGKKIPECEFGDVPFVRYDNSHFPKKED